MSSRDTSHDSNRDGELVCMHGHGRADGACYHCRWQEGFPDALAAENERLRDGIRHLLSVLPHTKRELLRMQVRQWLTHILERDEIRDAGMSDG